MEKAQILELAATIGKEVKESDLMKAYEKAEAAYVADEALQDKIREYSVQQQLLAEENKELASQLGIKQAPTLVIVKDGNAVKYAGVSDIKKMLNN